MADDLKAEASRHDATAEFAPGDLSRIIEMAWQDEVPFEALQLQFGLSEAAVIALMRGHLKRGSFRLWRERVSGRRAKHAALRPLSRTHSNSD